MYRQKRGLVALEPVDLPFTGPFYIFLRLPAPAYRGVLNLVRAATIDLWIDVGTVTIDLRTDVGTATTPGRPLAQSTRG